MDFQSAYSVSFRGSDVSCSEPSLTQQHFKDDADINVMLAKFKVTGMMPQGLRLPSYGDFTGVSDYREAAEAIRQADNAFMDLPAHLRKRFDNDPQKLMEFLADSENRAEAERLGLVPRQEPVPPAGGIGGVAPDAGPSGGQPA